MSKKNNLKPKNKYVRKDELARTVITGILFVCCTLYVLSLYKEYNFYNNNILEFLGMSEIIIITAIIGFVFLVSLSSNFGFIDTEESEWKYV